MRYPRAVRRPGGFRTSRDELITSRVTTRQGHPVQSPHRSDVAAPATPVEEQELAAHRRNLRSRGI